MESQVTLTENGQLGFETERRLSLWHLAKITHLLVEFGKRGGLPAGMQPKLPQATYPIRPKGAEAYSSRKRAEKGEIFKFGKYRWLKPMIEKGSLRFAPASIYRDPSLNSAIRDDELSFTYFPGKASRHLQRLPHPSGTDWVQVRHPSDYYVQCFSGRFAVRLFDDFEADSCLIIYDAKEFGRRLIPVLQTRFPDWIVGNIPISYVDPDDPGDEPLVLPAVKHMKYIYQQEQRIACHPRVPISKLEAFTIEVGSMLDIAEIVRLPSIATRVSNLARWITSAGW